MWLNRNIAMTVLVLGTLGLSPAPANAQKVFEIKSARTSGENNVIILHQTLGFEDGDNLSIQLGDHNCSPVKNEVRRKVRDVEDVAVLIVIDRGGKLGDHSDSMADAVGGFVSDSLRLYPKDQFAMHEVPGKGEPGELELTSDASKVSRFLREMPRPRKAGSDIYSSARNALRLMEDSDKALRAVIIVSDGIDPYRDRDLAQDKQSNAQKLIAAAKKRGLPISAIYIHRDSKKKHKDGKSTLDSVTSATGGQFQVARTDGNVTTAIRQALNRLGTKAATGQRTICSLCGPVDNNRLLPVVMLVKNPDGKLLSESRRNRVTIQLEKSDYGTCPDRTCDPECTDGQVCNNGACEDPKCDPECADNEVCNEGTCEEAKCDPDCSEGDVCIKGTCEPDPNKCEDDKDCDAWKECVEKSCKPRKCDKDGTCPEGSECEECAEGDDCSQLECMEVNQGGEDEEDPACAEVQCSGCETLCTEGKCSAPECTTDSECANGCACNDGKCGKKKGPPWLIIGAIGGLALMGIILLVIAGRRKSQRRNALRAQQDDERRSRDNQEHAAALARQQLESQQAREKLENQLSEQQQRQQQLEQQMHPLLYRLVSLDGAGIDVALHKGKNYSLGADPSNDVVFSNATVSGSHLQIMVREDGALGVVDLGSSNGTFVNDIALTPNAPVELRTGDRLSVSKTVPLQVCDAGGQPSGAPPSTGRTRGKTMLEE